MRRWLKLWSQRARDVPHTPLTFALHSHMGNVQLSYRVRVPTAGTMLGVVVPPSFWPSMTSVMSLRWVGGEDVVVPSNGSVPAGALRRVRFWSRGDSVLELTLGTARIPGFDAQKAVHNPAAAPSTIFVHALQNGRQTVIPTWSQGQQRT